MANSSLPRRLAALRAHLSKSEDVFGDWQFARSGSVAKLYPESEAEIVREATRGIVPFAGGFGGGVLALDVRGGDPERAPVVTFDARPTVLGESFDDFLALLASDEPDPKMDCWIADGELRRWIRASGIVPHPSVKDRLVALAEVTRQFWVDWATTLRRATAIVRPAERTDHLLVFGERIGDVCIGMTRSALDARWGTPQTPDWACTSDRALAFYPEMPICVILDPAKTRVIGGTLYYGRHRAVTSAGVEPLLMLAADAMDWFARLGLRAVQEPLSISVPEAGLRLSLTTMVGAGETAPWVDAVTIGSRTS